MEIVASGSMKYLSIKTICLEAGDGIQESSGQRELAVVLLSGNCSVSCGDRTWVLQGRQDVFSGGFPDVFLFPDNSTVLVKSDTQCRICFAYTESSPHSDIIEIGRDRMVRTSRGSASRLRYVQKLIPDDIDTNFILYEVFTPNGNWSSFPPHKHDDDTHGSESKLEEFYYYRFNPQKGFAFQWNFGGKICVDDINVVRNDDLIFVPDGYHTVCVFAWF